MRLPLQQYWLCRDRSHAGFLVPLVAVTDKDGVVTFRTSNTAATACKVFQVACECGWRSERFTAPPMACSAAKASVLTLNDKATEADARLLWDQHWSSSLQTKMHGKRPALIPFTVIK